MITNNNVFAIKSSAIFTGTKWLNNHAIIIKNGLISNICNVNLLPSNMHTIDYGNNIITAGFVDLQLNGCGGVLFNDNTSVQTLQTMHKTNLKFGTTSFLPTLITTTEQQMQQAVEVTKQYIQQNLVNGLPTGGVIGVHLEGPYISPNKKGVHNSAYITKISNQMVDFLCNNAQHLLIKLTLAPEENLPETITKLTKAGVVVSMGHSNATYNQAIKGYQAGAKMATHLFNAMSAFESRNPAMVGAVLNNNIYSGIIIDGHHVDYTAVQLSHKIKQNYLYIVTDAVTPMGTNLTTFNFANKQIFVKNGKCFAEDGTLAGANIDMLSSIYNAVNHCGIVTENAISMANINPINALINCTTNYYYYLFNLGKLQPSSIANIAVVNPTLNQCIAVIDNGKLINL